MSDSCLMVLKAWLNGCPLPFSCTLTLTFPGPLQVQNGMLPLQMCSQTEGVSIEGAVTSKLD